MQEEDPTAIEPEDDTPKPPIKDMPPEEGVEPPTDQQEQEAEAEFDPVGEDEARDEEEKQPRHDDLPEGALREDYDDESVE
jgi:hypothetical protein